MNIFLSIFAILGLWWCITGLVAALADKEAVIEFMGVGPLAWLLALCLAPVRRNNSIQCFEVEFKDGRRAYLRGNRQRKKYLQDYPLKRRQEEIQRVTQIKWKEYIRIKGKRRP